MEKSKQTANIETRKSSARISVVTIVYNRANQLNDTILSVLAQNYANIEYIVIDGGSTDGGIDIIKKYEDRLAYWISEKDNGIYDAMNKGIRAATGDWINFMNCGDRFYSPDALSFFEGQTQPNDIIYGDAMIEYPTFKTIWKKSPISELWMHPAFCHQAAFVRTALMRETPFDMQFKLSSDFDFMFKMWLSGRKFSYVNSMICWYDLTDGASLQNQFLSLEERKRSVLQLDFAFSKWIYFNRIILYARISSGFKKLVGKQAAAWITRLLRK